VTYSVHDNSPPPCNDNQSLDEILSTQRCSANRGNRRGGRRASHRSRTAATAAPVGGVKENVKTAKVAGKAIPTSPSAASGESKIVVSGMVSIGDVSTSIFTRLC
jgi:THO complex subunit 4